MKKNFFKKSMSATLALIMVLSVMAVLPISIFAEDETPVAQANLIPYDQASDGDLLYQVNFHGDTAFQPHRYLGWVGNQQLSDTTQYIVSEDGSELNIQGDATISGSRFHWWGGQINGLEAGDDKYYTMVYQVKPLDRDGKSVGMNNSISVGGWSADPDSTLIYSNYGNYGSIDRNEDGSIPYGDEVLDTRRMRINLQQTGIGKKYNGSALTPVDYTYFKQLENSMPYVDADGYMTVMVEYDAPNNQIRSYYLINGANDMDKANSWQQVQKAAFKHSTMNPELTNDVIGYWSFCSYHVVNQSVKNVRYYKGEYCQDIASYTIATADDLSALNATLNSSAFADADEIRIQLDADIDMTGKTYEPVSTNARLSFNGNGKTISNLTIGTADAPVANAALFATAKAGATFRNLKLENVAVYGSDVAAGLLAVPSFGALTVSNVSVSGTIDAPVAAGLIGKSVAPATAAANTVTWDISYCTNAADVTAETAAAGLIAQANGEIALDVAYCSNTGKIAASAETSSLAGGIVGALDATAATIAVTGSIENCYNTGELTAAGVTGGIVASYATDATVEGSELSLYNCFDNSKRSNATANGALVGTASGAALSFTNSYGAVAAESTGTFDALVGSYEGTATVENAGIVANAGKRVALDTGSAKLENMIERLTTAISALGEIEMPMGGFLDGPTYDYTWYYANDALVNRGTADAPYELANAAQFAGFTALINGTHVPEHLGDSYTNEAAVSFNGKHFKLTGDVDLTGYKVDAINAEGQTIVFDGNGKKISNWTVTPTENGGMFSAIGKNSAIKNLTLDAVIVEGTRTSAVVVARGSLGLNLYNVTTTDSCKVWTTTGDIAAGFVGEIIDETAAPTDADTVKLTFCVNGAAVGGEKTVGGLVGKVKGNFNYQISHCVNKGELTITSTLNDRFYVGGILGTSEGLTEPDGAEGYMNTFIKACYNTGKLVTPDTSSYCYVGGITGYTIAIEGAEIVIECCYDVSPRQVSTMSEGKLANAGIGAASNSDLTKFVYTSYATNAEGSAHPYTALVTWTRNVSAQVDRYSNFVETLDSEIIDGNGLVSTMRVEIAKIDAAIASQTEIAWTFVDPNPPSDDTTDDGNDDTTTPEDTTAASVETTPAPETTAPAAEKKGCRGALNSTYAVLALVSVLGFAFVAKKREEN